MLVDQIYKIYMYCRYDYSEKRSLPITIPSYQTVRANGERFVVLFILLPVKTSSTGLF